MTSNITITGDLGSGKSSVTAILMEKLKFDVISVGEIQRKLAGKYNLDTIEFNKYMESHPEIDRECDQMVTELGKQNNLIFDSRLAWHFVEHSFKIYLSVDEDVAAKRIFAHSGRINESYASEEEAKINIRKRRKSEIIRFQSQYGVVLNDFVHYDLVIDTSYASPEEVVDCILQNYHLFINHQPFSKFWFSPSSDNQAV